MTDLQLLSELSNKDKVSVLTKSVKNMVLDGEINPLEVAISLKGMEAFTKSLRSDPLIQDATLEELERYGGKLIHFAGAKFSIREVGVSYDYTECQDPTWDFLNEQMDKLKEKMEEREKFLKSLRKSETMVNDETGEVYTIYPPVKKSKTGYAVSL